MMPLLTARLRMRHLASEDAPFILRLLNEPSFLHNIGDRGVRTLEDARAYIESGPGASYARHGFGLYHTGRRADGVSVGICGLSSREGLPDPDVGFAFLPEAWGLGYASEAAAATLQHGQRDLSLRRILAITAADNRGSARVLEKIGMREQGTTQLAADAAALRLFVWQGEALSGPSASARS